MGGVGLWLSVLMGIVFSFLLPGSFTKLIYYMSANEVSIGHCHVVKQVISLKRHITLKFNLSLFQPTLNDITVIRSVLSVKNKD